MRKVKILLPFRGDTVGGSHISILETVAEINRRSKVNVTIGLYFDGPLKKLLIAEGIPFIFLPTGCLYRHGSPLTQLWSLIQCAILLFIFIKKRSFLAIHTNDSRMHLTWYVACKLARVPLIWHQRTAFKKRHSYLAKRAPQVIAISHYIGDQLRASDVVFKLIPDPVSVNSTAANSNYYRSELLRLLRLPEGSILVLWVGNLYWQKRPQDVFFISNYLAEMHPGEVHFIMVGASRASEKVHLNELKMKYDDFDRVHITGPVEGVKEKIGSVDFLLATAENEGFGRVLVEASIARVPVIASDDGGHSESITDGVTGRLFPVGDCQTAASALKELLANPVTAEAMALQAHRDLTKKHNISTYVAQIEDVYLNAIRQ